MKKISLPFNFKSSNLKTAQLSPEEKARIAGENENFASALSSGETKSPAEEEKRDGMLARNQRSQPKNEKNSDENQLGQQKSENDSMEIPTNHQQNEKTKVLSREEQLILSAKQIAPGGNPKLFGGN